MLKNEIKKGKGYKMTNNKNRYIRFDWAAKYMLRFKADFAIFEGFIFAILEEKVKASNYMIQIKRLFFVLLFVFLSLPVSAQYNDIIEIDGITYYIYKSERRASASGVSATLQSGDIEIPATVPYENDSYPVTEVNFQGNTDLTSVKLPESITSIESYSFRECTSLKSVELSSNLTSIGDYAFEGCSSLETISIPDKVTTIGWGAFADCIGLKTVVLGKAVSHIENSSFYGCNAITLVETHCNEVESWWFSGINSLTDVVIGDETISIAEWAFYHCEGLKNIIFGNGLSNLSNNAFSECFNIETIVFGKSFTNVEYDYLFGGNNLKSLTYHCSEIRKWVDGESVEEIIIGNEVTSIHEDSFFGFSNLKTLDMGKNVKSIGTEAFWGCSSLESITIPNSVTSIGQSAFSGCSNLASVTLHCENVGEYWFGQLQNLREVTFGDEVTAIQQGAFYLCVNLDNVIISDNVETIGQSAFSGCTGIHSLTLGKKATDIDDYAFQELTSLTTVTFHCPTIGKWFKDHAGIKDIIIGEEVTTIVDHAFENCTGLTSVLIPSNIASIGQSAFLGSSGLTKVELHTPEVKDWFCRQESLTEVVLGDEVTSIGEEAFYYCSNLSAITFPANLESIGRLAFYGCPLATVEIPASVESIGDGAFGNNDGHQIEKVTLHCKEVKKEMSFGAKELIIGDEAESIEQGAFYANSTMETLTIGSGVTSVGEMAFEGCSGLTTLHINCENIGRSWFPALHNLKTVIMGDNVKTITGNHSFWRCDKLDSVVIGKNVTTIGYGCFMECSSLKRIHIPSKVISVDDYAFSHCTSLDSVFIDNASAIAWGYYIFDDCESLSFIRTEYHTAECSNICAFPSSKVKEVVIGEEVTAIGEYAFNNFAFSEVSIPDNVTTIEKYAFIGCKNLKSITIPASVTTMGECGIFDNCEALASITINSVSVGEWLSGNRYIQKIILGEGVKTIAASAFSNCTNLSSVVIPGSVEEVGEDVFYHCDALATVQVDSKEIGEWFSELENLKDVVVGDNTEIIQARAFSNCTALENVVLGKSVSSIGDFAFYDCENLKVVNIPQSLQTIGEKAFYGSGITSFVIPQIIESIGLGAFEHCDALESVEFHCAEIGKWFARSEGINEIWMGEEVTTIGKGAFFRCTALENVSIGKIVTTIGEAAFDECTAMTALTIPATVTAIGQDAFYNCVNLIKFTMKNPVPLENMAAAFSGCSSDAVLYVPAGSLEDYQNACPKIFKEILEIGSGSTTEAVTTDNGETYQVVVSYEVTNDDEGKCEVAITEAASEQQESTVVAIPETIDIDGTTYTVTAIADGACQNNMDMTKLILPSTIKAIGENAFAGCNNLTEIYNYAMEPIDLSILATTRGNSKLASVFEGVNKNTCVLYVPAGSKEKYAATEGWKEFKNIVEMPAALPGDVNGDRSVAVADIVAIISYILGDEPEGFIEAAADVNGDSIITIADAVMVLGMIGQ